jgi:hypothetical protein
MAQIVTNPTPQQRFQQDTKKVTEHRDMVGTKAFEVGADFAMMEYNRLLLTRVADANASAAAGMKLQGALEFLATFRMLAESPTAKRPDPLPQNLKETN